MQFCGSFNAQISELGSLLKMQEPPGHSNTGWAWLVYSEMSRKMVTEVLLAQGFQSETPRKYCQIITLTNREKQPTHSYTWSKISSDKVLKLNRTLWGREWAEEKNIYIAVNSEKNCLCFFCLFVCCVVFFLICLSHTMLYIMFLKSLV